MTNSSPRRCDKRPDVSRFLDSIDDSLLPPRLNVFQDQVDPKQDWHHVEGIPESIQNNFHHRPISSLHANDLQQDNLQYTRVSAALSLIHISEPTRLGMIS